MRYYPLAPPPLCPDSFFFLRNNWPFIHFSSCRGGRTTLPVSNASHPLVFFFSNYYYFPMQRGVERRKPRLHIRIFLFWTFGFDDQGRYVPPPTAYPSPSTHFFSSKILKLGSSASNVQLLTTGCTFKPIPAAFSWPSEFHPADTAPLVRRAANLNSK